MRVVLDTNILLVSLPSKSRFRPIFNHILEGTLELTLSNEILTEYVEIVSRKTTSEIAVNLAELLLNLPNVLKVEPSYQWNLIEADPDDNKFVDCTVAGRADYLVTNDKHFEILRQIPFPIVKTLTGDEFLTLLTTSG